MKKSSQGREDVNRISETDGLLDKWNITEELNVERGTVRKILIYDRKKFLWRGFQKILLTSKSFPFSIKTFTADQT